MELDERDLSFWLDLCFGLELDFPRGFGGDGCNCEEGERIGESGDDGEEVEYLGSASVGESGRVESSSASVDVDATPDRSNFVGRTELGIDREGSRTQEICCQKPHPSQKILSPSSSVYPHIHLMSPLSATGSIGPFGFEISVLTEWVDGFVIGEGVVKVAEDGEGKESSSGLARGDRFRLRGGFDDGMRY